MGRHRQALAVSDQPLNETCLRLALRRRSAVLVTYGIEYYFARRMGLDIARSARWSTGASTGVFSGVI